MRKGIILAGGSGTRLYPSTFVTSKQLLPIYDKPMIFYPLSTLMLAGIRDILLISTPNDLPRFINLLGDGSSFGVNIEYSEQIAPNGLAEAFIIGDSFIDNNPSTLILGDNIFHGSGLCDLLENASKNTKEATIFAYKVNNPSRFGVVEFDKNRLVKSIEEKPQNPKSNFAATGLYFYDSNACYLASKIKPSSRGELEITDLNNMYLEEGILKAQVMGRGFAWLDTGTQDSLLEASLFIGTLQKRQSIIIGSPEEIAYKNGWIDDEQMLKISNKYSNNQYGVYLKSLVSE